VTKSNNIALNIKSKFIVRQILIFLFISCAFSFLIIKNFSDPLAGGSDIDIWEYMGFYLTKNLTFSPFPNLNLHNNQVFYPYGTSSVFQPWAFERDIFYAILSSLFGSGPWLKIYYILTLLITGLGTFALLIREYGLIRAMGTGYLVSYYNFYAIMEYPVHISKAVLHWTTLSFITDFLIVKRVVSGLHISLRLILLRVCLLLLSLGQDIGYIAGFALTSFTISIIFISIILCYRYFKGKSKVNQISTLTKIYRKELFARPLTSLLLIVTIIICSYIYIPLILQLFKEAYHFYLTENKNQNTGLWISPWRLLIPFFPGLNPAQPIFQKLFNDIPENIGAGSPGLFLLILAVMGIWQAHRQITIYVPLLTVFLLCLFYHPINFPTLHIFPWFTFHRKPVPSIYPVILSLFALGINFNKLRSHSRQVLSIFLVCLCCFEIYTAYSIKLYYKVYSVKELFSFNKSFYVYMNYVKEQPGEAVLDWPFCAVGGNGVGGEELCPYYHLNSGIYSLRRFHQKKVMGQYFGRLYPSQIKPYLQAGWDKLFFPGNLNIFKSTGQTRCFREEEWSFFKDFYKLNDFAGINLYVDLLPEKCLADFYKNFGNPVVETLVPAAGKVQFIPKSPDLRDQVNLALGASLKFERLLDLSESNLLTTSSPYGLSSAGLSNIETDSQSNRWRWALGPKTLLSFKLSNSQPLKLKFKFINPIADQSINVEINGVLVESISQPKIGEPIERDIQFQSIAGWNQIIFHYKDWNKYRTTFAVADDRPMAIQFQELEILP
jgi:hypothetical protein